MKKTLIIIILATTAISCSNINSKESFFDIKQKEQINSQEQNKNNFPNPIGYINDFENILSNEEKSSLNKIIIDFEQKTSNEIAIVTIKTIDTYTDFDKYAFDLSVNWGVGTRDKDNNGLTIVVSENLSRISIHTGTEAAKIIHDEFLNEVIQYSMVPKFKNSNYYKGIKRGLEVIINRWKLEE